MCALGGMFLCTTCGGKFHLSGQCRMGSHCRHAHHVAELGMAFLELPTILQDSLHKLENAQAP